MYSKGTDARIKSRPDATRVLGQRNLLRFIAGPAAVVADVVLPKF